jgi:DNA-directed RNA polymerase specialized sigma24 family protein
MTTESTRSTPTAPIKKAERDDFRTTRWTQVTRAKAESPEGRRALAELCEAYYEPVAAFLRFEVRNEDGARDLAHDFFVNLLEGGALANAARERGRFRSYLLGALKHFLSHHREALRRMKRGGGVKNISLHDTDASEARSMADSSVLSPDAAFDKQWAITALAHALERLRQECIAEGRADFFEGLKPWLTGEAAHGDQTALAARFGMNANALKVAVHRMKRRFRECLKSEIAGTLEEAGSVEGELRALFAALET